MYKFSSFISSISVPVTRPPVVLPRPDPCFGNPCGPNAKCQSYGDEPICSCLPDYIGKPPRCRPECIRPEECPATKACLDNRCVDPCPGICGVNAECFVVNHNPICSCIHGYTGDPFIRCTEIRPIASTPRPTTPASPVPEYTRPTTLPPIGEHKEITDETITPSKIETSTYSPIGETPSLDKPLHYDPCDPSPCAANAICKMGYDGKPMCECKDGYFGNPLVICGPHCVIDNDCGRGFACINRECKDPCPGACGVNAVCTVASHRPRCNCAQGYKGDPYVECLIPPISKTTSEHHSNFLSQYAIVLLSPSLTTFVIIHISSIKISNITVKNVEISQFCYHFPSTEMYHHSFHLFNLYGFNSVHTIFLQLPRPFSLSLK